MVYFFFVKEKKNINKKYINVNVPGFSNMEVQTQNKTNYHSVIWENLTNIPIGKPADYCQSV